MLKLDGDGPLYVQAYRTLRRGILDGAFRPGDRLPSTRALASELGVSRTVTLAAFDQLAAEGYVVGRQGSGTRVASALPERALSVAARPLAVETFEAVEPQVSRRGARVLAAAQLTESSMAARLPFDFSYGFAPPEAESWKAWHRLLGQAAATSSLDYAPAEGDVRLRIALARHLRRNRGIACDEEQIVLVSGSQQALDLCAQLLLNPGDSVLIEEPHYQGTRAVLLAAGARLVPVPVDEHGLDVTAPACRRLRPRLICVTPSHQFPTGAVMKLARRLALLEWAEQRNGFIVEDDYDGEYRYEGRPVEAVQALDTRGRTIYVGTLSKVLFPALRIGFVVLPRSLVALFRVGKWIADRHSPTLEQSALATFLESGHYERHLRRMSRRHASRRSALIDAITRHLGDRAEVMGTDAGIHLVLWLPGLDTGRLPELVERAAREGVGIYPITPYYLNPPTRSGLLLGYGAVDEPAITEGIERLARVLSRMWSSSPK